MIYTFIKKSHGFVLKDRPFLTPHTLTNELIPHDILEHPVQIPTDFYQEEIISFGGMLRVRPHPFLHTGLLATFYKSYYNMSKGTVPESIVVSQEAKDLTQKIDKGLVLGFSFLKNSKNLNPEEKAALFKLKNHNYKTLFNKSEKEFIEYLIDLGIKDFDSRFKDITQSQAFWLYFSINRKVNAILSHSYYDSDKTKWFNQEELERFRDEVEEFTLELDPNTPSCLIYNIKKPTRKKLNIPNKWYSPNSPEIYTVR